MRILHSLTRSLLVFFALVWIAALVLVIALTFVVSIWKDVSISGWNIAAAQISRWVVLWIGVYLIHNVLPIAVAHGRTRREFLFQAAIFAVITSAVLAALTRVGFLVETFVYGAMDWSREMTGNGVLEYFLMYSVWLAVGAFITAGFDRFAAGGLLTIPIGIALIIPASALVNGANSLPFFGSLPGISSGQTMLFTLGTFLVALCLAWAVAREMPIRVKAA